MEAKDAITCAREGDVDFFKTVAPDILLGARDERDHTVLTVASRQGHLDCCEAIVERCTQLLYHQDNIFTGSVLHWVVGNQDNNVENILRFLITADSKPDLERGGGAKLPNNSLLKMQDGQGYTALHLAVKEGNHGATKLLLEADRDLELLRMVEEYGGTCLHLAAEKGDDVSTKLILKVNPDNEFLKMTLINSNQTALHIAAIQGEPAVAKLLLEADSSKDLLAMVDSHGHTPYTIVTQRVLSGERPDCLESDLKIIRMLLEKDPKQCTKLEDEHEHPFIHAIVKLGLNDMIKTILKSKEIEATILNIQDKDGNTPLHIAALSQDKRMTLCLLYDARVSKEIENNKKEKAIDLINFPYDEAKARVYSLGHQSDLKDQSNFDLLVAALIATVSFTAGITVPGGYISDGVNKGSAILLKATAFKVFVVSNNIALLFSLYTVFLNFSTRRLLRKGEIYYESKTGTFRTRLLRKADDMIYPLNAATLCTLSAVYAMVVAFITGSYAVLDNSEGLAITVCVISCFFLILALHAMLTMAMQYCHSKPLHEVFS